MSKENTASNPIATIQADIAVLRTWREQDRKDIDKLSEAFANCVIDPKKGLIVQVEDLRKTLRRAWKIIAAVVGLLSGIVGPYLTYLLLKWFG